MRQIRLRSERPRELTGRVVLVAFLTFFAIVIGANATLIRAASKSFGGVETESSYKAGLAFKQELAFAQAQKDRNWKVDADLVHKADGGTQLDIAVRDRNGQPIASLDLNATLAHPTDRRLDVALEAREVAAGRFRSIATASAGQWELTIEFSRNGERLFRSRNRVVLR